MQRNNTLDLYKGLAITLVLVGHAIQATCNALGLDCFDDIVFKTIYTFHMPLFMLISGYLFYFTLQKSQNYIHVFNKRFVNFILPIITLSLSITILTIIFSKNLTIHMVLKNLFQDVFLWRFWFLWSILLNTFVVSIAYKYISNSIITIILIAILFLFIPDNIILAEHKFVYPFFILGFIANKKGFVNKLHNYNISLLLLVICYAILWYFYKHDYYIYNSGFSIIGKSIAIQIYYDVYRFVIGCVGCALFMLFLYKLKTQNILNIFIFLGQRTLGIYVLQMFAMAFTNKVPTVGNSFALSFIIMLLVLGGFSIIGTLLSEKTNLLRFLVLGKTTSLQK